YHEMSEEHWAALPAGRYNDFQPRRRSNYALDNLRGIAHPNNRRGNRRDIRRLCEARQHSLRLLEVRRRIHRGSVARFPYWNTECPCEVPDRGPTWFGRGNPALRSNDNRGSRSA